MNEHVCATIAGGACVAGISLSVVNSWLTAVSLLISVVAGVLAIRAHYRNLERDLSRALDQLEEREDEA